jgi:hypothetical protein
MSIESTRSYRLKCENIKKELDSKERNSKTENNLVNVMGNYWVKNYVTDKMYSIHERYKQNLFELLKEAIEKRTLNIREKFVSRNILISCK